MKYENIKVEKQPKSLMEISGQITVAALAEKRTKAVNELSSQITIPGFRKGHVPEKVLVDNIGEVAVLDECAELVLKEIAPEIIEKNVPEYIGQPRISITKLVPGNPVEFKISIAVRPEVKLPDYQKISKAEMAKKGDVVEVFEKEIADVIEEVLKQRAHVEYHKENSGKTDHDHDPADLEKHKPELTDDFVKNLGDFKDVADFKAKIKENLTKEKEHKGLEKRRGELLEKLVAESTIDVPQILIESELNRMFAQFESDIAGLGLKVEDYLKHIKKEPNDLVKEWMPDAEKRAKLNLLLEEIAKKESISADKEAVEQEVKNLTENHKDIDPERARAYTTHILTIEKVIQYLEGQK
jgi:trigger factor